MAGYFLKSRKAFLTFFLLVWDAVNVSSMAWFLKKTMDAALGGNSDELREITVLTAVFLFAYSAVSWAMRTVKAGYLSELMYQMKQDCMDSLLRSGIREFLGRSNADYISVFNNDMKMLEEHYFNPVFRMVSGVVTLLVSLVMMISIQPAVTAAAVALSFLPVLIPKLYGPVLAGATERYSEALKKYNGVITDLFSGFETIKSFSMEPFIRFKHKEENAAVERSRCETGRKKANADVLTNFVSVGMQFAVFLLSGYFVLTGRLTAGGVLAITQLMSKVTGPVFTLIDGFNELQSVRKVGAMVTAIVERNPEENAVCSANAGKTGSAVKSGNTGESDSLPCSGSPERIEDRIELKQVTFRYPGGGTGVEELSLTLERGKKYAVVGESGSGKTTLLKLILGYYDSYSGRIEVDGTDRKGRPAEEMFHYLSVMDQDVFLFEDTIRENITLHRSYAGEQVDRVVERVGLGDTLRKKRVTLNYRITRNGDNLSGGERQKIALARALIRGSEWLVLDEATSNLDNRTLRQIEELILSLKGVACITVTHRYYPEILKQYDRIFVMRKGRLEEQGTFEELMTAGGIFYGLYRMEAGKPDRSEENGSDETVENKGKEAT